MAKRLSHVSHGFDDSPPEINSKKPGEVLHSTSGLKTAKVFKEQLLHSVLFTEPDGLRSNLVNNLTVKTMELIPERLYMPLSFENGRRI
jgi:hypothetical protein